MRIIKYAFYYFVLTYHILQAHASDNFMPWITSQNQLYIMGNMGSLDSKNHHTKQSEVSKDLESKKDFSPTAQNDKQRITQNAVSLENDKKACHTDLECSEREVSKNTESQLVIFASVGKRLFRVSL